MYLIQIANQVEARQPIDDVDFTDTEQAGRRPQTLYYRCSSIRRILYWNWDFAMNLILAFCLCEEMGMENLNKLWTVIRNGPTSIASATHPQRNHDIWRKIAAGRHFEIYNIPNRWSDSHQIWYKLHSHTAQTAYVSKWHFSKSTMTTDEEL